MPLYRQIGELLVRDIEAGRLLDGERLEPERDLAVKLGTSVGTLRKALSYLEERGLLERRHGSGNYVCVKGERDTTYAFFRIEKLEGGGSPTAEVLSVDRLKKPTHAPHFGTSQDGYRIRRLRRLDGIAAALEEIWLDAGYAQTLDVGDLSHSLYATYREALGLWIMRAEDRVSVGSCPDWAPDAFGCAPGAMCGFVERTATAQTGATAEWSRSWFDPASTCYVQRLK
ncbi:MAG: GntR family transcriptional regulator [Pseudomonadota bacterium]